MRFNNIINLMIITPTLIKKIKDFFNKLLGWAKKPRTKMILMNKIMMDLNKKIFDFFIKLLG